VLIGVGAAWLFTGGRKKLRLPTTGKHWITVIIVVVVVLAIVYGAQTSPHTTVGH
jgi:hypothetical protein